MTNVLCLLVVSEYCRIPSRPVAFAETPFNRDLLVRHQKIYHSIPDGLDPVPARVGSHRPDVACVNCHKAKCMCDKQKPVCGACQKRGIECVPRQNQRAIKAQARANRSAAAQKPATTGQLTSPTLPAPDERNHQPAMQSSLEDMLDGESLAYQQEISASEASGSPNSFMSGPALTGNLTPGGPFPITMDGLTLATANYHDGFEGFGNPIQPFSPKDADFGSQGQAFSTMADLSRNSSFGTDFEGYGTITEFCGFSVSDGDLSDYGGFADYGGFMTNDDTHHSLAGNQQAFKHVGQNDGNISAHHRRQMSTPLLSNAIRQQVYPHFESADTIMSFPPTPNQDFAMRSYGLPSPAKTTPSPPPTGSYSQFATDAELKEKWKTQFGNVPFEVLENFISTNKELLKKRGSF